MQKDRVSFYKKIRMKNLVVRNIFPQKIDYYLNLREVNSTIGSPRQMPAKGWAQGVWTCIVHQISRDSVSWSRRSRGNQSSCPTEKEPNGFSGVNKRLQESLMRKRRKLDEENLTRKKREGSDLRDSKKSKAKTQKCGETWKVAKWGRTENIIQISDPSE